MKSILNQIRSLVSRALASALGPDAAGVDTSVRPTSDPKFGDYQSNVAMGLAKTLSAKPRDVAEKVVSGLMADAAFTALCDKPEIAGPGFINLRLNEVGLRQALRAILPAEAGADRLGVDAVEASDRQTVVVDYSSPNVAKEMHVGHLRSTIIGDVFARVLAFQGHEVIRQNHLGDWGTQFGKIILALWHVCMCKHQGETVADLERVAGQLMGVRGVDVPAAMELLRKRCEIHQAHLDRDPSGAEFDQFIRTFEPSFQTMLPAYRYVNAVEEAAEGADLTIVDRASGERYPLSAVSRFIAAMLQGKTNRDNGQELAAWRKARDATLQECNVIYRRLGVLLNDGDVRGESFYEPMLPGVVEEMSVLLATTDGQTGPVRGLCRRDKGAMCVFLEKPDGTPVFKGPQGDALPVIIQKSDGASLYATTDLAGMLFRMRHPVRHPIPIRTAGLRAAVDRLGGGLGADRALYVVGSPFKLQFEMVSTVVRVAGWTRKGDAEVRLEHVSFGSVLGQDRKMLRTRSGDSAKLKDLLDEAVERAGTIVREAEADPDRRRGFSDDEVRRVSETVGIASVKYADLCQNRNTDYVFSWDKMLAMSGNTAPYLLYAYARIRSIHRKGLEAGGGGAFAADGDIRLDHPAERALGLRILQLAETLDAVADTLLPNILCEYLYDLAGRFMQFYEACPVLQAPDEATRASRLRLCDLAARALRLGLSLLGIEPLERM